jgi:septum formation protein
MKVQKLCLCFALPKRLLQYHYPISSKKPDTKPTIPRPSTIISMSTTTSHDDDSVTTCSSRLLVSLSDRLAQHDCSTALSSTWSTKPELGRLILASQSPRRREILDMMGLVNRYKVEPSPLDESQLQTYLLSQRPLLSSKDYPRRLAEAKAEALAHAHQEHQHGQHGDDVDDDDDDLNTPTFYLGSDTIVELDESILEKPRDKEDAQRMLTMLSGRQHRVHTGVALYRLFQGDVSLVESFTDSTTVTFATLGLDDITAYIESGEPLDKAGSYGIQGIGGQFVTSIQGDYFTVMGMPMHRTSRMLALALQGEAHRAAKR